MNQTVKRIAFIFCLWPLIVFVAAFLPHRSNLAAPASALTSAELRAQIRHQDSSKIVTFIPIALGLCGAAVMAIDAFRRDYDTPSGVALAFAVLGFISLGAFSAIYYLTWGWMPTKRDPAVKLQFCERCVSETADRSAANAYSHNLVGTRLMGQGQRCDQCGSTVKTYWVTFLLPLLPMASYRVLPIGKATAIRSSFLSRKLSGIYWQQVWPNILILLAIALLIAYQVQK